MRKLMGRDVESTQAFADARMAPCSGHTAAPSPYPDYVETEWYKLSRNPSRECVNRQGLFPQGNDAGARDDEYTTDEHSRRRLLMKEHIVCYLKRGEQRRNVDSRCLRKLNRGEVQRSAIHREEKGRRCKKENAGWQDVVMDCDPHHCIAHRFKYRRCNYERESFHRVEMLSRFPEVGQTFWFYDQHTAGAERGLLWCLQPADREHPPARIRLCPKAVSRSPPTDPAHSRISSAVLSAEPKRQTSSCKSFFRAG